MPERLFASLPLLFVGLAMAIDPSGLVLTVRMLSSVVRTIENRIRGVAWSAGLERPDESPVSERVAFAVRLAGAALCLCVIALLAGR